MNSSTTRSIARDQVVSSNTVNPASKNRCFKLLRSISAARGILPKSYYTTKVTLSDTLPYASGGFALTWKGLLDGRQVCVKAFPTQTTASLQKIKLVCDGVLMRGRTYPNSNQRFYREIVGWKYISHPNVVPFCRVSEALFPFCFITPWMPNGNIVDYVRENQSVNRLQLVSDPGNLQIKCLRLHPQQLVQAASGLGYLHSLGIIHSDINPVSVEHILCLEYVLMSLVSREIS